jgi:trehalose 6-phosphate synthase
MDKASAIEWLRQRAGARARFIAFGDDITDEDMFKGLAPDGESVLVGPDYRRATGARWNLDGPESVNAFLRWLLAVRRGDSEHPVFSVPRRIVKPAVGRLASRHRLLVISNRLPELRSSADSFDARKRNVGGLVSALEPALRERQGIWLGWSGTTIPGGEEPHVSHDDTNEPNLAWVDLPEDLRRLYYNGLCNRALWPLLHSFLEHVRLSEQAFGAYRRANDEFAKAAVELVGPNDMVWVHDYHLMLLGARLRERGHKGPIGLFVHAPFPAPDVFFVFPWAEELLGAMLSFDLVGFHTNGYVQNFNHCVSVLPGTRVGDDAIEYRGRRTHVGAFPIGIIPEKFQEPPHAEAEQEVANLMRAIAPSRLVLGVDRLDYTKGIPERLTAFARLLELHPEWRRKVSLVQISVPSRNDVPDYAEQRERVERVVGRTNGEFGDADWVPIRYLYRSFGRSQLSLLYRNAAIGYVTPMRDGMNLVAKEFVASQNPDDPGVLLLSRFAGAAVELSDAVLTNPWYVDGLAHDLDRALHIGIDERRARHKNLLAAVSRTTALTWAEDFLAALSATRR